jgi:predicted dehydrogenase/threonine dehydrogenase-like Zn-dependent dehydrogenase
MMQVTQKLKDGDVRVKEVPFPMLEKGSVLVRNIYSCISIGTESGKVNAARKGYIGKARERPQQFKQVLEKVGREGIVQTYRAVMKRLDALSPLGYSCVGHVVEVAPEVKEISVGDFVACGGGSANHSEVVCVPENLCVRIHPETDLKQAAYNTLGAIAMQGVRQSEARLGEVCAVIGLGVVGQLSCILLRAAGIRVIGIDTNKRLVSLAEKNCVDVALERTEKGIKDKILRSTNGMGADAVIIAASSDSLDPINFAGAISRKKGTVVVIGGVPTGFDREPDYYQKELTVKMSCSYGPGRYDSEYEVKGRDYPYAYVRWTERRNMQAFQDLIYQKRIDLGYLTTHTFSLDNAPLAYDMILRKSKPFMGVLIEYDYKKAIQNSSVSTAKERGTKAGSRSISVGFIGAGSYAQRALLPNIVKRGDISAKGIMTKSSTSSRSVADKFGFEYCTSNPDDILGNPETNAVFIATQHDSHGRYVIRALEADKSVFVEKPICVYPEELEEIRKVIEKRRGEGRRDILMVGYNRRFSPLTKELRRCLSVGPMSMIYRINAGFEESDSWAQDREIGGGRIVGEACHFVDYASFMCNSLPVSVQAISMDDARNNRDTTIISIKYQNGSIANISYFANGSHLVHKEYVEVYQDGMTAILDDYRKLTVFDGRRRIEKKLSGQNKGQKEEVEAFFQAVRDGNSSVMPFEEIYSGANVIFKALESMQSGNVVRI